MTGSPFSNVLGHAPGDSTFTDVLSEQVGDTTSQTDSRPDTDGTEPSVGVESDGQGNTHVAGEDETAGQTDASGTNVTGT